MTLRLAARWLHQESLLRSRHLVLLKNTFRTERTSLKACGCGENAARISSWRGFASQHSTPASAASPSPHTASQGGRSGSGMKWSAILLGVPSVIAAYLGTWQLQRREQKIELLAEREARMAGEPLDLFAEGYLPPEYTRVTLIGTFDYSKDAFIGPRGRPSGGMTETSYLVVTPLTSLDGKRTVLVNRGWVPLSWKDHPEQRKEGEPSGKVAVTGVLRHGERAGQFVPRNNLESCTWHYINTAELAQAAKLDPSTPLVEAVIDEEEASLLVPKPPSAMEVLGGRTRSTHSAQDTVPLPRAASELKIFSVMPGDHFNYAATWFTLSAATAALAVKAARQLPK